MTTFKTIRIRLATHLCVELAACEEGAYEDSCVAAVAGRNEGRPPASHAHVVATNGADKGVLVISTAAEADDMYYAVCSGVFKSKVPATLRAAQRIADILRPFAQPETVRVWDKPDPEPFNGM
jgi:hypothetical protein